MPRTQPTYDDARLILRLYELRREPRMREARQWFVASFHARTFEEYAALCPIGSRENQSFRMVTSYWDMVASFVLNGAIDEQMFNDANGEQLGVFAKMEPFLADYRARSGNPRYLSQLEQVILRRPGAKEQLATIREWFKQRAAAAATK